MPSDIPLPPDPKNWADEEFRAYLKAYMGEDTLAVKKRAAFDLSEWVRGSGWRFLKEAVGWAIERINDATVAFTPVAIQLSASTMNQIAGTNIDPAKIGAIAAMPPGREQFTLVGQAFRPVIDGMFPIDYTAANTADRKDRSWAINNVNAYFGTNLLFQLRSLTIGTIASFVPEFQLRHLEGLHQTINWAYGFGWLSWTVMSSIMDVTTTKPLREYYNKLIKPQDLTSGAAIKAFISGLLPGDTLDQILDNDGLRTDIRNIEIALAEKDFTSADLKALWYSQQMTEAQLLEQFRLQTYGPNKAQAKVDLLKVEREQEIRDEYINVQRQLFRDCVIDETELRQTLTAELFNQNEADWIVKVELARRRIRTFLPTADMVKAIKLGLLDVNDAANQLQCRGYTYDDMVVELLLKLQDKLPPCDDVALNEKAMIELLQALGSNIGISGKLLRPNVLKYLQCLDLTKFLVPPIVSISSSVNSLPTKGNFTLTWSAKLATHAKIEPQLGPVPLEGSAEVHIIHSTGFTITAESPIGKSSDFVFVRVEQPG